jgi:pimeloyl-ACP methyl ester carboxylesterase
MHRLFPLALLLILLLSGCNGASNAAVSRLGDDGNKGFMVKSLKRGIWTRKYGLFVPLSYHPGTTQKYPVIIFLHGIGEGAGLGEGDRKNLTVGIAPSIARKAGKLDFIVLFPQSDGSWNPDSDYTSDMFTALANTAREYPVDSDRIILTGISTGGAGTWAIGAKYADQFAAIVPMASNGSNPGDAARLTHTPVRAYCSVFGDVFAGWNDQGMVNRIKSINPSADAQFIATPTFGHDCWENVYNSDEFYEWAKKQRRNSGTAAPSASAPPAGPISPPVIQASLAPPSALSPPAAPPRPVQSVSPPSALRSISTTRAPATPSPSAQFKAAPALVHPPAPVPPASSVPARNPPPSLNTPW